jgi:hypothetical protein
MSPRPETGGRRIRVCVVGLRGLPGVSGGVEAHCEQLYPRIAKDAALAVTIVARRPYVRERGPFTFKGTSVVPIWAVRRKYLEAFVHTACAVALARFRYSADILHIHAIGPGLRTPLARLLGMKVVVTHHGEDYNRDKWNAFA